ncbi:aldo/keto reductase [Neoconidiobolus thromboides FSU 785]|nr:aldo/keto reductase [Neoconidiobolus thromboides FSU 785]
MNNIQKRQLGKNGPLVSGIGLGCMGMTYAYGEPGTNEENYKVLNRALDLGCDFWDTADVYGAGENERLLSKILKERRDEIFLCTKFGLTKKPDSFEFIVRGDKEYVKQACDASLKRLEIKTIDLYYQHRVDPNTPIEETVEAMAELVNEGKVRYLGLSECSAKTLRRAHKVHPIAAVQVEYSPWETGIEKNGLLDTCKELGVAVIAFSPLGRGFLTGKLDVKSLSDKDYRATNVPRLNKENVEHNIQLVEKFQELSNEKNIKPSQLCLSWLLSQGDDIIPIPGTKKIHYLEENLESLNIKFSDNDNQAIRELVNLVGVKGGRYNQATMNLLDKDI